MKKTTMALLMSCLMSSSVVASEEIQLAAAIGSGATINSGAFGPEDDDTETIDAGEVGTETTGAAVTTETTSKTAAGVTASSAATIATSKMVLIGALAAGTIAVLASSGGGGGGASTPSTH